MADAACVIWVSNYWSISEISEHLSAGPRGSAGQTHGVQMRGSRPRMCWSHALSLGTCHSWINVSLHQSSVTYIKCGRLWHLKYSAQNKSYKVNVLSGGQPGIYGEREDEHTSNSITSRFAISSGSIFRLISS